MVKVYEIKKEFKWLIILKNEHIFDSKWSNVLYTRFVGPSMILVKFYGTFKE